MNVKTLLACATLLSAALPGVSHARDTQLLLPFDKVVQQMLNEKKLDGSVRFYLAGVPAKGKVSVITPAVVTNKKTNAFNKSDTVACEWVLQSALLTLQDSAKKAGANAVTNIASFYKRNERRDPVNYECHAGAFIAGVALKGDLADVK